MEASRQLPSLPSPKSGPGCKGFHNMLHKLGGFIFICLFNVTRIYLCMYLFIYLLKNIVH